MRHWAFELLILGCIAWAAVAGAQQALPSPAQVAQAEAQVMGIEWRPLYQTKRALRGMLAGLAVFADSVVALLLYLPVIVAWVLLGFVVVNVGWMALVRTARAFFPGLPRWRKSAAPGM